MIKDSIVSIRRATADDRHFLSQILLDAAAASGVNIPIADLPKHTDTYQYIEGFPQGNDVGVIAQTHNGNFVGAAWLRLLPTEAHAINEPLPELTMGVVKQYQRKGYGKQLLETLYKEAASIGIPKIALGVHKNNIPALNLYKQQDWIVDGYFQDYVMMSKKIKCATVDTLITKANGDI